MQKKLAEYLQKQDEANKLLRAATDEAITHLVGNIENTFKAIKQLKEIAPDYAITKLSKFRKLAATFGLGETASKGKGRGKAKSAKGKTVFKLSDDKAKVILDFIGAGEKSTQEIADKLKTKNASNALTYLKEAGKIKVAKKEGLKKFWKRV
jgi:hypothetical protein